MCLQFLEKKKIDALISITTLSEIPLLHLSHIHYGSGHENKFSFIVPDGLTVLAKLSLKKTQQQSEKEKHSVREKRFSILADEKREGTKQIICYYNIIKEIADDIFSFSRSFAFTMFEMLLNHTTEVPTHFADLSLADLFCPSVFPTLS